MKNSDSNNWLIPLLAAFAIYVPLSSIPPSPDQRSSAQQQSPALIQMVPPATPTPAPTPGPGRVPGEAAKLLCDFFGAEPKLDQGVQGQDGGQKQARPNALQNFDPKNRRGDYCLVKSILDLKKAGHPAPAKYEIEYLIATVPDPKDSRLDHMFDRYLDAIQRAIGAGGYTFDRYWLPWDKSRTAAAVVLPTDSRTPQTAMAPRHLYEPGVILFRNRNDGNGADRLLLLFLVGETPTGGIHKVAFQNALWQVEELSGWKESKPEKAPEEATEKELRIISPCFSGSDASLATLLREWIHGYVTPPKVRIISGAATSIDKDDFLEKIASEKVSFYTTVVKREQADGEFYKYLKDLDSSSNPGDDGPHVALLSEASTASGQRARRGGRDAKGNENKPAAGVPLLSLTFPLHISQLRVEASKTVPSRDDVAAALAARDPDLALPMREAGSPASKDIVPLFSPLETVTMDLTLDEMLSEIHRERIRYVGVLATDVQDRIFLVREIREHCPNAMIFIHNNDLLYLHSESNFDFQGALVISAYPLFGLNQLWTYPFDGDQRRLQFSTQAAQGLYNATLALLNKEDRMLEYGLPLEQYEDGENRYPALWLGIVGRNGIWPVKTFDIESFKITEQSLEGLKSEGVPHDVLGNLRGIIDKEFNGKRRFLAGIEKAIGDGQAIKFKKLFLRHARDARDSYTLAVKHKADGSRGDEQKKYHLGLSANYWSPTGIGILLLIGVICLFLPLVFLAQLILFWGRSKVDKANPDLWREGRSKLSRAIIGRVLELEREIEEGNVRIWLLPAAWIRSGWPGQVFGDEEFYCYRLERRIILLSCCACLLTVTLFISSVAMLPAWMAWKWGVRDEDASRHWWKPHMVFWFMALVILVFALVAFLWLAVSIIGWMIGGRRHFRGYIRTLLELVVGAAMVTFVGWGLIEIFRADLPEQVFFFLRATELTSGVSILLPGLLVGLAAFLSFFNAARRLNLAERMPCLRGPQQRPGDAPQFLRFDHERAKSFEGLKALEDRVKEMIVCPIFKMPGAALVMIVILIVYWRLFLERFIPSVDGRWFDRFFEMGFYIAPLLLIWALMRFFWLWEELRRLLRRLSWHPLISQYAAEHSEERRFASLPLIDLMTPTPTFTALSVSVRRARSFYEALKLPPEEAGTGERIKQLVEKAESKLSLALKSDAKGAWQEALRNRREAQAAMAELTEPVAGLLEGSWRAPDGAHADAGWQDEGKFFLITQIVAFLQHIFAHLQNLIALVTIGLLLLLVAANSYPFRPRESLLLFSWVAILASVVVALFVFVQMSRDKTLSLLTGRVPGRLNITRDFVMRVLIHGVVPVIALLGAQFPQALRQIFSWLSVFEGKGG